MTDPIAVERSTMQSIANAIRAKDGTSSSLAPSQMANAIASIPGGSHMHNYSTEEQIVGTWIDGKPLYEKTLILNNISLGTSDSSGVVHGIENIDQAFVFFAYYKDSDNSIFNNKYSTAIGSARGGNGCYQVPLCIGETHIWSLASDTFTAKASRTWIFVLRYTKTTDIVAS